jgi:hypothetical protein
MEHILAFVSKKGYKWPYLVLFTLATILYAVLCAISETKLETFVSIITAFIDWIGIYGFVNRKTFFEYRFWRGWFVWSILWFLFFGAGRDILGNISFDPTGLILLAIIGLYYGTFFVMLYGYAYAEERIWR